MVEAGNARKVQENVFIQPDWRADGGARRIRVTRDGVLIARRLSGVAMKIRVPLDAYQGVALDVLPAEDGSPLYLLSLAHRDSDFDILLCKTQDGGAVAADWKYWASWLGLPRLSAEEGVLRPLEAGAPVARRRDANVSQRRPRFLARRK
ncbi:DUF6101 family protein [Methylocystis sp. 9N]|uniref:DUF6101 family protein n=1 Tax=Methylocystis borbori TaxID=3118750 RepID=A0ABU7XHN2_9HYPH